mmetsp:Transcript_31874/g.51760  ORF Transcript_31874/g.51760 Transcript_31874/m.51760 type:complete len:219 (+) Transcript_31874:985-1641(+)
MASTTTFGHASFGIFHIPSPTSGILSPEVRMACAGRSLASASSPRNTDASTLRGPSNGCRECIVTQLSTTSTSPFSQANDTFSFSMNAATSFSASASTALPSPRRTALVGSLRESTHPVKAATTELKKIFCPVLSSVRMAGTVEVVVLTQPFSSHSQVVPSFFIASSASPFVLALNVFLQLLPIADLASSSPGMTRTYLTPNFSILAQKAGCFLLRNS